jgi:hypothetical protein
VALDDRHDGGESAIGDGVASITDQLPGQSDADSPGHEAVTGAPPDAPRVLSSGLTTGRGTHVRLAHAEGASLDTTLGIVCN